MLSQITQAALPVHTRVISVYVHGLCTDNGQPHARAFCGVWFHDNCAKNTHRELNANSELQHCTVNTAALGAVLCAVQQCESLLSEWPKSLSSAVVSTPLRFPSPTTATHPFSPSFASSSPLSSPPPDAAAASAAAAPLSSPLPSPSLQSAVEEEKQQPSPDEEEEADVDVMTSNGLIKLFSAKTIAPFVPEAQREPSGSAKRPVVLVIFTDSEYVTKALNGGPSKVIANRHLIVPLQVLTRDFNVFVLRCPAHSNGIVQAQSLARQSLLQPAQQIQQVTVSSSGHNSSSPSS